MRVVKKIGMIILLGLALLAVVLVLLDVKGNKREYVTAPVERGNIKQLVTANGQLNPTVVASVGTRVSGEVTKLYVDVNDEVKKSQLIAEIDPAILEAQLKQSKSALEIARINYEQAGRDYRRSQELFKKDYIAKVEVERALQSVTSQKLSYESAQLEVEQAQLNLGYTQIKSPIDGVVIAREVTEGQTVASSFQAPTLFKIAASLVDMKIDVTIPESDIGQLKVGMPVTFTVDAYPSKEFEGTLASINTNPNTGQLVVTYSAEVTLKNDERLLFPGMTAYVNVTLSEVENVLKVPAVAFRFQPPKETESAMKKLFDPKARYQLWLSNTNRNEEPSVYVLRNGEPQEIKVQVGMMDEEDAEIITEQLKEGDEIILSIEDIKG